VNVIEGVETIKRRFAETGSPTQIPKLRTDSFIAEMREDGIWVDNLGAEPYLPWAVFQEAICVLIRSGGRANRGNAMGPKLGDKALPLDSIEGHIAYVVYGKRPGQSVFRRITPVACILIWAGVCRAEPGELVLSNVA
jgi:hypothetical protein